MQTKPDHPVAHSTLLLTDKLNTSYFLPLGLASKQLCILEIRYAE